MRVSALQWVLIGTLAFVLIACGGRRRGGDVVDDTDSNMDGVGDACELTMPVQFVRGDANGDGSVGFADFLILSNNFGKRLPQNTALKALSVIASPCTPCTS